MNRPSRSRFRWASLLVVATATVASSASAQDRAEFDVELSTGFNSNVFLLSQDLKLDLADGTEGDFINGRFTDMESAGDLLTTVRAALTLNGRGLGGHRLRIVPALEYVYFAENKARREVGGVAQPETQRRPRRLGAGARTPHTEELPQELPGRCGGRERQWEDQPTRTGLCGGECPEGVRRSRAALSACQVDQAAPVWPVPARRGRISEPELRCSLLGQRP